MRNMRIAAHVFRQSLLEEMNGVVLQFEGGVKVGLWFRKDTEMGGDAL